MRVIRALVTLTAVWGALLTLLLVSGRLPPELQPGPDRGKRAAPPGHGHESSASCDCPPPQAAATADTRPELAPAPPPDDPAPHKLSAPHYAVCEREEGAPAFSRLELGDSSSAFFAMHCGPSVHVIAIDGQEAAAAPVRVLRLRAASHNPAESPQAGAVAAADVDGDGRADLIVPVLFRDRAGAPSGGALYLLRRRAEGSFDPAARLLDLAPGAVRPATLDAQPGSDLALLHLRDARSAHPSELWLVRGGPSPVRSEKLDAGVGASALGVADLDLDGLDDVAVVSEREGRLRLFLSGHARAPGTREALALELPGVREVVAADLDGDGHRDLVLGGERVWLLRAQREGQPTAVPIADSALLRDVQVVDANADGKLDIVGYAHPSLIVLEQTAPLTFTRKTFATLRGDMAVLFARLAFLDRDPRAELVLVLVSAGPDAQIELGVAPNLNFGSEVELEPSGRTLRDTPLPQQIILP